MHKEKQKCGLIVPRHHIIFQIMSSIVHGNTVLRNPALEVQLPMRVPFGSPLAELRGSFRGKSSLGGHVWEINVGCTVI
jgi:hypothetical protein